MELKGLTGSDMNKLTVATMQVDALRKQVTDAQATIAALQAERDTARRRVDELEAREVDVVLLREDLEKRTVELEAANHTASTHQALWREACDQRDKAQAELERVRVLSSHNERRLAVIDKKYKELHGLVLALPKVERAVVVSNGYVKDSTRCHALFGADEDAALYAALLQHRQGMEG